MNDNIKKFIPVFVLGIFFISFGIYIYLTETFVVVSKYSNKESIYVGKESIKWSYSVICFGVALMGPLFKKNLMIFWMSFFLSLAVTLPLFR